MNGKTFESSMRSRYLKQRLFFGAVRFSALLITLTLLGILAYILAHGFRAITWEFLTQPPTDSMTKGGIMPAIVGTLYLTVGAILVALPLGVISAIYLTEYARQGALNRIIRVGVNCLAGVPSVVFGLFGLGFFVVFLKFGSSILAGALTLGILILPTIIGAAEEALKAVPQTFREASRKVCGTALRASSAAPMIVGRIRMPSVSEPARMLEPNFRKTTKNPRPKSPKTTEGTPARQFTPTRMIRMKSPCFAYSVR
jgi:ABC-type phosphate transport system permease subunit